MLAALLLSGVLAADAAPPASPPVQVLEVQIQRRVVYTSTGQMWTEDGPAVHLVLGLAQAGRCTCEGIRVDSLRNEHGEDLQAIIQTGGVLAGGSGQRLGSLGLSATAKTYARIASLSGRVLLREAGGEETWQRLGLGELRAGHALPDEGGSISLGDNQGRSLVLILDAEAALRAIDARIPGGKGGKARFEARPEGGRLLIPLKPKDPQPEAVEVLLRLQPLRRELPFAIADTALGTEVAANPWAGRRGADGF